jgi:DtxR family Mn-dependent transcriptional regulator
MGNEKTEEYLETILSLMSRHSSPAKNKDIARELDIAPATVTEMIQRLSDEGFVKYTPYRGVELTAEGVEKATELQYHHNILRDFLSEVLHIDAVAADREACVLEHFTSEIVLESMMAYMEEKGIARKHIDDISVTCRSTEGDYARLNDLDEGEEATVALIHLPQAVRDKLMSMGIATGETVRIRGGQEKGSLSVLAGDREIVLDRDEAGGIFVMLKNRHFPGDAAG